MAVIHKAYTFDPHRFGRRIKEATIVGGDFRSDLLHSLATETVRGASGTVRDALNDIRFHEEWLDASDDEVWRGNEWYMIVFASMLTPAPSLSVRQAASHYVLRQTLPLTSWSETQIKLLLHGKPMRTLAQSSGGPLVAARFVGIDQFGGWLDLKDIGLLHSRMQEIREEFRSPSDAMVQVISDLAALWVQPPGKMLADAHSDASDMLDAALTRKEALFLILD